MLEGVFIDLSRESLQKFIRLVMIMACYVLARGYYTNWSKTRQVAKQIARDKQNQQARIDVKLAESMEDSKCELMSEKEVVSFGWGKKTLQIQKEKEKKVKKLAEQVLQKNQTQYDAAEDHDIENLLQD